MGREDDYTTVAVLGRGGFGVVKKVRRATDNKFYACKIIHFREGEISLTEADREYATLKRLHHPHIIEYIDYRWQLNKAKLYMEYCSGGDLRHFISESERLEKPISESQVWCVLSQIACALLYCHYGVHTVPDAESPPSMPMHEWDPIIHRDIKPANILVNTNASNDIVVVKLGDFGLSRIVDTDTMPDSYAGTRQYQPPEIARANPHGIRWTKKSDIFSLGCTLYEMCTWKAPFSWRMEESDVYEDLPSTYSERLRKCIACCLAFHSEERHDAFDLLRSVRRTRADPVTRHLILPVPDPPHEPVNQTARPRIPHSPSVEVRSMPGAFETEPSTRFGEAEDTIRPRATKTSDQPNLNTVIHHHQPSKPLTVIDVVKRSNSPNFARPDTELKPHEILLQSHQMYSARCPLCGLKFLTPKNSVFSEGVQDHFESTHTKKHGQHLCPIDECRFSKGAGIYSEAALFDHSKVAHGQQPAERVGQADRRLRSEGAAPYTVGEVRPDPSKWFCPVLECPYSVEKFVGFINEDTCLEHMYYSHSNEQIVAYELWRAEREPSYVRADGEYSSLLRKHRLEKAKREEKARKEKEHAVPRNMSTKEPKLPMTQQQRDEETRLQIQAIDDMPEKPRVLATNGKFYCADTKCPYSVDQFVGFHTSVEGRRHQQTHPGWTSHYEKDEKIQPSTFRGFRSRLQGAIVKLFE